MSQTSISLNNQSSSSKHHVISWSGGKDSTATIILFHEHEKELRKAGENVTIIFSEVMFDKKNYISGHNPEIISFIYKKKKIFESWGYKVEILHSDKDYLDVFYHKLKRSPNPERIGLTHGFILGGKGRCSVKRDCKLRPINQWYKNHANENLIDYIGIAVDEPLRLVSMHKKENTVSLLEKYNYSEKDAMNLCKKYQMVSPQYSLSTSQNRDGCWFCPNAKLCEHAAIAKLEPKAWEKYVSMENEPNLAYPKWNPYAKETLHEREKKIKMIIIR